MSFKETSIYLNLKSHKLTIDKKKLLPILLAQIAVTETRFL